MNNKPYLIIKDKSGELVAKKPTREKPNPPKINTGHEWNDANYGTSEKYYQNSIRLYNKHLDELPSLHLDPSIKGKEGDRVDGVEQWQQHIGDWVDCTIYEYDLIEDPNSRRKILRSVKKDEWRLRPVVQWFAEQMESALRRNDHKGGWGGDNWKELYGRLNEETTELYDQLNTIIKNKVGIVKEAADVANFAMMIADNYWKEFGQTNPDLPQEAPKQGAELKMVDTPKPIGEFILAQGLPHKELPDGHYWHYKDVVTLLSRYAAQPAEEWVARIGDDKNSFWEEIEYHITNCLWINAGTTKKIIEFLKSKGVVAMKTPPSNQNKK